MTQVFELITWRGESNEYTVIVIQKSLCFPLSVDSTGSMISAKPLERCGSVEPLPQVQWQCCVLNELFLQYQSTMPC